VTASAVKPERRVAVSPPKKRPLQLVVAALVLAAWNGVLLYLILAR